MKFVQKWILTPDYDKEQGSMYFCDILWLDHWFRENLIFRMTDICVVLLIS